MRLGFVGTGSITRAVVTGLVATGAAFEHISLSPRNASVAAAIAELDPRITICKTNQEVLDTSDVVCLAVVPDIAVEVLDALAFRAQHHVISFIAGLAAKDLKRILGEVSAVVRAIPLPSVAAAKGTTAICPADAITRALFAQLGVAVEVSDERQFDALSAMTATMASYYALLETQASWLLEQGMDYASARAYLSSYYAGLSYDASLSAQPFSALVAASMTPGGINEQLHRELSGNGTYDRYRTALDNVLLRIGGR